MVHHVKMLATRLEDLIRPRSHIAERENHFRKLSSDVHMCSCDMCACMHAYTYTNVN